MLPFSLESFLLMGDKLGVVARVVRQGPVIKVIDILDNVVEELTVVRDDEQGAPVTLEVVF